MARRSSFLLVDTSSAWIVTRVGQRLLTMPRDVCGVSKKASERQVDDKDDTAREEDFPYSWRRETNPRVEQRKIELIVLLGR